MALTWTLEEDKGIIRKRGAIPHGVAPIVVWEMGFLIRAGLLVGSTYYT